ncbi:hypothetical protein IQ03_03503 [Gemmobacter caeni]|uniref:Uncharacterized protein n=1 Tax=Gemmobacter caeni TaxID=589035 RepID=A0A2T6AT49_9RHOB|nr:hypothetical protein [Gemmobacter caeni]PTX47000.1 hypothetical protein C8N34_11420 [Gemmobacter caeni]TWI96143.1 hypothetical protein IQ03_03503 [Gemmobacter caeni]
MILGPIFRRRGATQQTPVMVSRMAVAVVHAASRTFSNADVSLAALVAARRMIRQPGRSDVSLASLTAARRMTPQTGAAAPSLATLTVARKMDEPDTDPHVSRMFVAVVHT